MNGLNQPSARHLPAQNSNQPGPHQPFSMSGLGQQHGVQDAKDGDVRQVHIKEEHERRDQQRERDMQRQHMDHVPPHQTQSAHMHLHQPVAVGTRSVHGPNGLLGNPAAMSAPNGHSHLPAPGAAVVYNGGAVQPPTQPAQAMQPSMLLPFGPGPQNQAANVGQGQQPILNVCLLETLLVFGQTNCMTDATTLGCPQLPRPSQGSICRPSRRIQQILGHHEGFQERSVRA